VLEELRKISERRADGRLKHPFTRRLTDDIGHPKLREHLASVILHEAEQRLQHRLHGKLNRIHPRYDKTLPLPFKSDDEPGL
jgi:hypothetical protein